MTSSSTSPPQLSDEDVNAILDGMNWQDDDTVDEAKENENGKEAFSHLQDIQDGVELEAVTSALEDMINGKSHTFTSSSSILKVADGEDVVVGGSSGDASISLDVNKLLKWEKSSMSCDESKCSSSNTNGDGINSSMG